MELDRMLRIAEILQITGVSAATIWRWVKDGIYPAPVKLGPNSVGWRESAIREWLESREPVGGAPEEAAQNRGCYQTGQCERHGHAPGQRSPPLGPDEVPEATHTRGNGQQGGAS